MLLQLCVGALRVAFERREPPNSSMERGHVLGPRQIMLFVENLQAFNFHLAQALIHAPTQESSANGWSSAVPVVVLIDTAAKPWRNAFIRERALSCGLRRRRLAS